MRVFKFGGASVKDASGVQNLAKILLKEGSENLLVIVSAMGKMTNAFEQLVNNYFEKKQSDTANQFTFIKEYHHQIIEELFDKTPNELSAVIQQLYKEIDTFLIANKSTDYNYIYDQLVIYGELISTTITSHYLASKNITNKWLDARSVIVTDENYRHANVNWTATEQNIKNLDVSNLLITQGFIAKSENNNSTTLGREGSDFSASIFAFSLHARSITIWKDVIGVLNADPRHFNDAKLLEQISYEEAIEMAFYGATVIHPKTLKPLENKKIPLFVRSFIDLSHQGTKVHDKSGESIIPKIPCYILKQQQILVEISAIDFSFILEHHVSDIFKLLHINKLKVNMIQNSALKLSLCLEDPYTSFGNFLADLQAGFNIKFIKNVSLFTIRHKTEEAIDSIEKKGKVLLKQRYESTVQILLN